MVRRAVVAVAAVAMLLAVAPAAFAQAVAVAQLQGTVVDSSGGALPSANVTLTDRVSPTFRTIPVCS